MHSFEIVFHTDILSLLKIIRTANQIGVYIESYYSCYITNSMFIYKIYNNDFYVSSSKLPLIREIINKTQEPFPSLDTLRELVIFSQSSDFDKLLNMKAFL